MIPRTRTLSLTGLRAVHNARTRIFAAGSDPLFRRELRSRANFVPASSTRTAAAPGFPLWRRDLIDRLQPPVTRFRD